MEIYVPGRYRRLGRRFFARDPRVVASELIGCGLACRRDGVWCGGAIVETEAYLSCDDLASHSRSGPTARCRSMFNRPGTLYVYTIHAKYCMNLVTEKEGIGSAVLVRAIEPLWGLDTMVQRRRSSEVTQLTRGPARLCQALAISKLDDGVDVIDADDVTLFQLHHNVEVAAGPRIGISQAIDLPLRFYARGNRFVSGTRKHRQ